MSKKVIVTSLIIIVALAAILIAILVSLPKDCLDDKCFEEHFQKCKATKFSVEDRTEALVGFAGLVDSTWEIMGEKRGGTCRVKITIDNVTDQNEMWAKGTSAYCYLPMNLSEFEKMNPLEAIENNCQGSFAAGVVEHCYLAFGQKNTRCDGPLEYEDTQETIVNKTLDPQDLCTKLNENEKDISECYDTLQVTYDAFRTGVGKCEDQRYSSDKEDCEEAIITYSSYNDWYFNMANDYEEEGLI